MKIWLLQRSEPTPHDNNGKQRAFRMGIIAQILARKSHKVIWWTSTFDHYNRYQRYQKDTRVPVQDKFDIQYLRGCGYHHNISFSRIRENRMIAQRFSELAAKEKDKPDLILASIPTSELAFQAVKYGKKNDIPIILDIRDLWPDVFFDLTPKILHPFLKVFSVPNERLLKKTCRDATGIIGNTKSFVDWGVVHAGREHLESDRVFHMGYLNKNFTEERLNEGREYWNSLGIHSNSKDLIVVFFGILGKFYDILTIIEAAQILQKKSLPVKFIICGDGEKLKEYKKKAQGINNVVFPGWVQEAQIRSLLEMTDIGLTPHIELINFIMNISNKPAEYLSGGAAIALSLDRGELYELLKSYDCGFSYNGRAKTLASELDFLYRNPERLTNMKKNALQAFKENFVGETVYGELVDYLVEIVNLKKEHN